MKKNLIGFLRVAALLCVSVVFTGGLVSCGDDDGDAGSVAVAGVSLPETAVVALGKTTTLRPSFTPENVTNTAVTWQSSDTGIATVTKAGVVKGVAIGEADITVTTDDGGFTATCTVTVKEALVLSATNGKTTLYAGETVQLLPEHATDPVTYVSNKTALASVNETGLVTVVSPLPSGTYPATVTITATDAAGSYDTIDIIVDERWADKASAANAAGTSFELAALNCKEGVAFDDDGIVTNMAIADTVNEEAGAYLVYPVPITKASTISIEARVIYSASSNTNGTGFLMHDGTKCIAYRFLTDQGIKSVINDAGAVGSDMKKTGGNGLTYYDGFDAKYLLSNTVVCKTSLASGVMTQTYYTISGTPIAMKSNNYADYFADDAKVYLAVGGQTTENMKASYIYVEENNVKKLATSITASGLAGMTLEKTITRINFKNGEQAGTGTVNVTAINADKTAAKVKVTSKNTGVVTATVADPNSEGVSVITLTAVGVGTTSVTVEHENDSSLTRSVQVSVDDFTATDPYTSLEVFPAQNATAAPVDGFFRLTFASKPELQTGGAIMIYKADGTLVDTILFAGESLNVWTGVTLAVRDQLVYVDGNSVYFMPHYGALAYGTDYYVAVPKASIKGTVGDTEFATNGLSNSAKTWSFKTRSAPTIGTTISVCNDESDTTAAFRTVQAAMTAVAADEKLNVDTATVTINVAAGTYNELDYYKGKANLIIAGPSENIRGDTCVLTWNNYEKMNSGTHTRAQFYINGANLTLKNLRFVNKFRRTAEEQEGQAECIYFAGGNDKKLVAYNCSFASYQDTIQTTGRNWFYDCYIEGDVDFIWGTADAALFEKCDLHSLNDENRTTKTADLLVPRVATLTSTKIGKGYVVLNCTMVVDADIKQSWGRVAGTGNFYDQCAVINTSVTGAGLIDGYWNAGTSPVGLAKIDGVQHVGWKDYGVTVNGVAVDGSKRLAKDFCGTIDEAVYAAEYANRNVILNRVWNATNSAYEASENGAWDLTGYYTEFGITD